MSENSAWIPQIGSGRMNEWICSWTKTNKSISSAGRLMHELCICSLCVTSERRNSGESSVLQVGYHEPSDWTRKGCTKPDVVAGRDYAEEHLSSWHSSPRDWGKQQTAPQDCLSLAFNTVGDRFWCKARISRGDFRCQTSGGGSGCVCAKILSFWGSWKKRVLGKSTILLKESPLIKWNST